MGCDRGCVRLDVQPGVARPNPRQVGISGQLSGLHATSMEMGIQMNREDAVRLAAELVEKMGNLEDLNKRGYKIDGWKSPTVTERAEAIEKIANLLIDPERQIKQLPPAPSTTVFGWALDGSGGEPTAGQYLSATQTRRAIVNSGRPVLVHEMEAIDLLIRAYEETHPKPPVAPAPVMPTA